MATQGANSGSDLDMHEPGISREEWARRMRLKFSPHYMLNQDGSLNLEYFKPKTDKIRIRRWTERERAALIKGIEKYGIGKWEDIRNEFLPEWEPTELRKKTSTLMGRQSLVEYIQCNWRGDAKCIAVEYKRNKEIGAKLTQWKGSLIKDEAGLVKHEIEHYPFPPGYSNPYMSEKGKQAQRSLDEEIAEAKQIVGRRVVVWFEDAKKWFGGLLSTYDEKNRKHNVVWDPEPGTTVQSMSDVELKSRDRTTDPANAERWCLESELKEYERRIKEEEEESASYAPGDEGGNENGDFGDFAVGGKLAEFGPPIDLEYDMNVYDGSEMPAILPGHLDVDMDDGVFG